MGKVILDIVLLYSNRSSGELGNEVVENLRQKLGGAFHVRKSSWNVELLRSPKLRDLAAGEAAGADIVMISMDEGVPVSSEIQQWFELWCNNRRSDPSALVALLKREDERAPRLLEEALHRFAEAAQMDFFCHTETRRNYPRVRADANNARFAAR